MQVLRNSIEKAKHTSAALWSPGKSKQMYIGRQGQYWRVKVPQWFESHGLEHTSRQVHTETEAADILQSWIEPLGLTLKDVERLGCPEDISDEDDSDAPDTFNLQLLATVAIDQKISELPMLLLKHKQATHRHHFGNPQMQVERAAQWWTLRVPPDLEFFVTKSSTLKFPTSQQAHLHIKALLEPYKIDSDLLLKD